ncbi:30S ribosomal protein S6 [Dehalogenimonas alkenigignens]|uniref:30S ribosomal protein S6 n=1 Tax=Dehalogenimonas alkenigignens TaxID=1217799 RepID=UPI003CCCC934
MTGWHVRPLHHGAARKKSVPIHASRCQQVGGCLPSNESVSGLLFAHIPCAIIPKFLRLQAKIGRNNTIAVKEKKVQPVTELLRSRTEPVRNYELVVIYRPELVKEKLDAGLDHIAKLVAEKGGSIASTEPWGKRKLAYPIKHQTEGIYFLVKFSAVSSLTKKINNDLRLSEDVLRHLIICPGK